MATYVEIKITRNSGSKPGSFYYSPHQDYSIGLVVFRLK